MNIDTTLTLHTETFYYTPFFLYNINTNMNIDTTQTCTHEEICIIFKM